LELTKKENTVSRNKSET